MPLHGDYAPSAMTYAHDQVDRYERTGGREGGHQHGKPVIILTTRGARSGYLRKSPVMRVEHGGVYAAVASYNGAPAHPAWYRNLVADPRVMVQDGPEPRDMIARVATGEERERWWRRAVDTYPDYADYQEATEREIPVVILEPAPLDH
ncbi:nitroreductase family deazaflavin-dependent oxidoreductase [Streptomonospora sediminis]